MRTPDEPHVRRLAANARQILSGTSGVPALARCASPANVDDAVVMESAHVSTIEDAIAAALEAKLAPLRTEIHRLAEGLERLRHALPPPLVSMREAARTLDVSLSTIRRRVRDGSLRAVRVGNMLRVDLGALHG